MARDPLKDPQPMDVFGNRDSMIKIVYPIHPGKIRYRFGQLHPELDWSDILTVSEDDWINTISKNFPRVLFPAPPPRDPIEDPQAGDVWWDGGIDGGQYVGKIFKVIHVSEKYITYKFLFSSPWQVAESQYGLCNWPEYAKGLTLLQTDDGFMLKKEGVE